MCSFFLSRASKIVYWREIKVRKGNVWHLLRNLILECLIIWIVFCKFVHFLGMCCRHQTYGTKQTCGQIVQYTQSVAWELVGAYLEEFASVLSSSSQLPLNINTLFEAQQYGQMIVIQHVHK